MELQQLTIRRAQQLLRRGELGAAELADAVLERIVALDNCLRAYITLTPELALEQARAADARLVAARRSGEDDLPPLLGIPLAIKDVLCTAGIATTCGSRLLEDFVPPYDATVVARLEAAGMVLLGKTNTDEFGLGSSTENSAFFATRNPWDPERVPGGSSGGSAAAVAAGEALGALGTDTGGSIRQPAAFCGLVGLKPTYGLVSRYGLAAFASSLEQAGPLTADVADAALLLGIMAGPDGRDPTCSRAAVPDYPGALSGGIRGLRIGVPEEYMAAGLAPGVEAALRRALTELEALGAVLEPVSLPHTEYALPAFLVIAPAEASSNLARYDGVRYGYSAPEAGELWALYRRTRGQGFGAEVKRRIMLGTHLLSANAYEPYFLQAQKARTLIRQDFERALQRVDLLVAPTAPTVAFRLGAKARDPLQMYNSDTLTLAANLAGICALSIPCGFSEGLPVGMQIIGRAFDEATVLRTAYAYEQATPWHSQRPKVQAAGETPADTE